MMRWVFACPWEGRINVRLSERDCWYCQTPGFVDRHTRRDHNSSAAGSVRTCVRSPGLPRSHSSADWASTSGSWCQRSGAERGNLGRPPCHPSENSHEDGGFISHMTATEFHIYILYWSRGLRQLPVVRAHCSCRTVASPCCSDAGTPHIHELMARGRGVRPCCCWSAASGSERHGHKTCRIR